MIKKTMVVLAFVAASMMAAPAMAEDNTLIAKFKAYLQAAGASVTAKISERVKKSGIKPTVASGRLPSQTPIPNMGGMVGDIAGTMGVSGRGAYTPGRGGAGGPDPKTGYDPLAPLLN
ncbi:hypothetical protein KYK29_10505 [Shinella daejeonensis]|uniref:hypothetical protein n=1 Tax=Shinella daejeonensis TaxID=659017 RepID=UPI0020C7773D|nr:hypothetical protein [Shinella daejeonensis]MCP8895365.1 hypothetical protein [Shinella daejeonensis]